MATQAFKKLAAILKQAKKEKELRDWEMANASATENQTIKID
jgi:hypothetical protein